MEVEENDIGFLFVWVHFLDILYKDFTHNELVYAGTWTFGEKKENEIPLS